MSAATFDSTPGAGSSSQSEQVTTSNQPVHNHSIPAEDRAAVVGKCLTTTPAANPANNVIEVLVDIAG